MFRRVYTEGEYQQMILVRWYACQTGLRMGWERGILVLKVDTGLWYNTCTLVLLVQYSFRCTRDQLGVYVCVNVCAFVCI